MTADDKAGITHRHGISSPGQGNSTISEQDGRTSPGLAYAACRAGNFGLVKTDDSLAACQRRPCISKKNGNLQIFGIFQIQVSRPVEADISESGDAQCFSLVPGCLKRSL